MTIRAAKFTPEVLLSAPRRSAGLPNSNGSKVLYSVSTYSFAEHSKKSEIRILDVKSQQSSLLTDEDGASAPKWLDDNTILILTSGEKGATNVKIGPVEDFRNNNYTAGTIDGPAGDLKICSLEHGSFTLAFSSQTTPSGEIHNPEKAQKPHSSGKLYKSLFVRHWDHFVTPNRNSIWLSKLSRYTNAEDSSDDRFKLEPPTNALKGTNHECPIPPFGGTDHFDIGHQGLIYTAKDPDLNPALHTKTNVYVALDSIDKSSSPIKVEVAGIAGASTSPVFSPTGKQAAFLSMRTDGYESDKNQLFIIPDTRNPSSVIHCFSSEDGKGKWDRSPQSITWSRDGKSLYLLAEDKGRVCLYHMTIDDSSNFALPEMVMRGGAISDVQTLKDGDLFVSSTSLIDNSIYQVYDHSKRESVLLSSLSREGSMFGLSSKQISEISWEGAAKGTQVHAFVVKPSFFNEKEKYPLAYLIHGGPQGAWEDSWSTRWNPAVFAEQGYVVICPNPTGSTGYGQAFTDAIREQWGGLPYEDLVKGFDWIEKNLEYVDIDRAVALGASYGGYMMNWFQGHPLGRKFKALVTHDGVFSMLGQLASEELYFPFHDLNGKLWTNRKSWEKWDPSLFLENWATPNLIIHSDLDYRLSISEGLSAFNVLQTKGIESQFLTFPDENHWVLNPENSLVWHEVVLDWINGYVGLPSYSESRKKGTENEEKLAEEIKEKL